MAPYTFLENIETEVPIPDNGILSRTLFNDEALKVVAFGFSAGRVSLSHRRMPWSFAICAAREKNVSKETLRRRDMTFAPTAGVR
jgi:hypothetical protein